MKESQLNDWCRSQQLRELEKLLDEFNEVFLNNPGLTYLMIHDIELTENKPVRVRSYRMSIKSDEILKKEIK